MDVGFARSRAFSETARSGTMTAAAASLGYSVGAVSQQVGALEREVGQPLFDRVGRGRQLTEAGTVLLRYADPILLSQAGAMAAVSRPWEAGRGRWRCGSASSAASRRSRWLRRSTRCACGRRTSRSAPSSSTSTRSPRRCAGQRSSSPSGSTTPPRRPQRPTRCSGRCWRPSPSSWRSRRTTRDGGRSRSRRAATTRGSWVRPTRTSGRRSARCAAAGFEPAVAHAVTDTGACLAMAASGLGVTPATRMMHAGRPAGLRLLPLEPWSWSTRDVVLPSRTSRAEQPLHQVLLEVLRAAVAPYELGRHTGALASG